jgi:hypothetical protein
MSDKYRQVYPNVLRHYAASGQLLASNIVMPARKSDTGMYKVRQTSALMVSNDRIGWLTMACQYFEFRLTPWNWDAMAAQMAIRESTNQRASH